MLHCSLQRLEPGSLVTRASLQQEPNSPHLWVTSASLGTSFSPPVTGSYSQGRCVPLPDLGKLKYPLQPSPGPQLR